MQIQEKSTRARSWLKQKGLPFTDNFPLRKSQKTFDNGALFGIEIPVINSADTLKKTINWLKHYNISCDRFNETRGTFLLPETEIKEMLSICHDHQIGMVFSLSPRPEYDVKASFYRSKFGLEQCRRLNNLDSIAHALEEALRLADLGCRGLIVYDIGVLQLLFQMRKEGKLPENMIFKASSHCMATNPFIAQTLALNGADSITTMHDVSLIVLQEMRRLCPDLLLDVPIDVYPDKGGYIRFNEIAEIVQVASPVMLKIGASAQINPYSELNDAIIHTRIKRVVTAMEHLKRAIGDNLLQMAANDRYRCIPAL